jgi:hypothetical protein
LSLSRPSVVYEYEWDNAAERTAYVERTWLGEALRAAFSLAAKLEKQDQRQRMLTN